MVPDEANATAVVSKDLLIVNSDEAEVEGVRWRGNELWNGQEEALNAIVQTGDSEQLVDVVGVCVGPGFEGSNADVKMSNNNSRKVRLLSDVISSLQTPEEKRKAIKKGRGRPRKAIVSNVKIADISLSDSNLRIELVFLVETKFEVVSEAVVKSPWWTDSFSFLMLAPEVLSRGILIIWELGNLDARDSFIDPNFILIRGVWCVENWDCAMIATYAPFLSLDERRRCVGDTYYGWFRLFRGGSRSVGYPGCGESVHLFILNRGVSDHAQKGHVQLMESEWCRIGEEASMPVTILEKLRQLKSFLKVWNRESFRSVDLQIEVTTDLLNDLDERVGAWKRFRKLSDNYKVICGSFLNIVRRYGDRNHGFCGCVRVIKHKVFPTGCED
ncbi:hypothetical protein V6N13_123160 [Hibiscus sabdariffa]